jgi:hypothetical protein
MKGFSKIFYRKLSKIGTSKAISIGAYNFALRKLDSK